MIELNSDVTILGSGFGGSITALALDRMGLSTVLVERAQHPRFAIGESSTPIANMVLRELARRFDLPRLLPLAQYESATQSYPKIDLGLKRGFSYFHHQANEPFTAYDDHRNELLVSASQDDEHSDTHWLRADVDAFLAAEVQLAGIQLLENTALTEIHFDGRWRFAGQCNHEPVRLSSGFAIDASGAAGVLLKALNVDSHADSFATNSRAIFGHFRGVKPWHDCLATQNGRVQDHPFRCDDAAVHHLLDDAWMWQLRFRSGVTSAGFVLNGHRRSLDGDGGPDVNWHRLLSENPTLRDQFQDAELVAPAEGIRQTGRMQRASDAMIGPHWAALPNTAGVVDPLHSTGIAQTMCGIERLAWVLESRSDSVEYERRAAQYSFALRREFKLIDKLVAGCYLALHDFEIFHAYAMMYFAAATTFEHRRFDGRLGPSDAFLCADDMEFCRIVDATYDELKSNLPSVNPRRFLDQTAKLIEPFNLVGLCDRSAGNMYRYTAAPI